MRRHEESKQAKSTSELVYDHDLYDVDLPFDLKKELKTLQQRHLILISEKVQSVLQNSVDMVRQERKKLEIETSGSEEDSCESSDVEPYACPGKKEIV